MYTLKIFKYFQKEFRRSLATSAHESVRLGNKVMYDVKPEDETEMECSVIYITHENGRLELTCTWKYFESVGWLCKHCIRILDHNNIKRIPEEYVLQMWTKTSKDKVWDRVNH